MPRRPLLLVVLAAIISLGLAADLGVRNLQRSQPAAAADGQETGTGTAGAEPDQLASADTTDRERLDIASRQAQGPRTARDPLGEPAAAQVVDGVGADQGGIPLA